MRMRKLYTPGGYLTAACGVKYLMARHRRVALNSLDTWLAPPLDGSYCITVHYGAAALAAGDELPCHSFASRPVPAGPRRSPPVAGTRFI